MSRPTQTRSESSENIFDRFGTVLVPFIGMGLLRFSGAEAGRRNRLPMEDRINPDRKRQNQSFRWLHEIDQILVVGMKYGPTGTQEAVKRVRQLTPEVVPAQVWHRMRHLREKERGKSTTPVDWSESAIEILREGYRSGGRKKTEAIKTVRALYPGLAGYVVSRFARSQGWLNKEHAHQRKGDRRNGSPMATPDRWRQFMPTRQRKPSRASPILSCVAMGRARSPTPKLRLEKPSILSSMSSVDHRVALSEKSWRFAGTTAMPNAS